MTSPELLQQKRGDPSGRRIAKRRALLLAEAGRLGRATEVLLERAGYDTSLLTKLLKDVAGQEQVELMRGHGRVESRKRFKHSTHPLLDQRSTSRLYVDESGKSNVEPGFSAFFALAAVAVDDEDVGSYQEKADRIKIEFFGSKDITFHEPSMRNHDGRYYFDGDTTRRAKFDEAIDRLIGDTKFTAFGVGIRKHAFQKEFVEAGIDPYLPTDVYSVAIVMLLERYVDFLASRPAKSLGFVTFESQGCREDVLHQLEYARVLAEGSQWVPESAFRNWLAPGLCFAPKRGSDPLELADSFARETYEWIRSGCAVAPRRWHLFADKIYCRDDGCMGKFGVKVFPDSDIRDLIEAHRTRCGAKK